MHAKEGCVIYSLPVSLFLWSAACWLPHIFQHRRVRDKTIFFIKLDILTVGMMCKNSLTCCVNSTDISSCFCDCTIRLFTASGSRVSCPMLNPFPNSVHFWGYLYFGALYDFFLWSIC